MATAHLGHTPHATQMTEAVSATEVHDGNAQACATTASRAAAAAPALDDDDDDDAPACATSASNAAAAAPASATRLAVASAAPAAPVTLGMPPHA